jgi:hypothetical protein
MIKLVVAVVEDKSEAGGINIFVEKIIKGAPGTEGAFTPGEEVAAAVVITHATRMGLDLLETTRRMVAMSQGLIITPPGVGGIKLS